MLYVSNTDTIWVLLLPRGSDSSEAKLVLVLSNFTLHTSQEGPASGGAQKSIHQPKWKLPYPWFWPLTFHPQSPRNFLSHSQIRRVFFFSFSSLNINKLKFEAQWTFALTIMANQTKNPVQKVIQKDSHWQLFFFQQLGNGVKDEKGLGGQLLFSFQLQFFVENPENSSSIL